MYKSIYVPVDNSDHSNRAVACAVGLGKAYSAKLVGCHVYAAKLHDYRFRQMEYTLPEEYIDEIELERQRKIHDSLITMGLKLISDSYLDGMSRLCGESGIDFEPRMMDGKHHTEILKDLAGSAHDLVVIGALGIGRARDSVIGSVCERVARQSDRDVWVVKHVPEPGEAERDTILVGIDGSPQSFGALMTAIDLARTFGKKIETIAVYDPYLHYSVFNGIHSRKFSTTRARRTPGSSCWGESASTARRTKRGSEATPRTSFAPRPATFFSRPVSRCRGSTCARKRPFAGRRKPRSA
jgi:nucleotide-binding universal stress UspA family protein